MKEKRKEQLNFIGRNIDMTYRQAVKIFKTEVAKELFDNHVDYWTGQLAWSTWVDGLCKDGTITNKQYENWATPFKYGKHL